eukprot:2713855-Rhodomonas_salina.1
MSRTDFEQLGLKMYSKVIENLPVRQQTRCVPGSATHVGFWSLGSDVCGLSVGLGLFARVLRQDMESSLACSDKMVVAKKLSGASSDPQPNTARQRIRRYPKISGLVRWLAIADAD